MISTKLVKKEEKVIIDENDYKIPSVVTTLLRATKCLEKDKENAETLENIIKDIFNNKFDIDYFLTGSRVFGDKLNNTSDFDIVIDEKQETCYKIYNYLRDHKLHNKNGHPSQDLAFKFDWKGYKVDFILKNGEDFQAWKYATNMMKNYVNSFEYDTRFNYKPERVSCFESLVNSHKQWH